MIQCGNLCGVHKFPRWLLCKEKNIGTLKSFQKAMAGLSNKKSGQTVVTAPSRLQPVAPALVGATGYDSPPSAVSPARYCLVRDACSPMARAISVAEAWGVSVRYCKISALRARQCGWMYRRFFIAIFSETNGSSEVRLGPKLSVISGVFQRCFCQTAWMLGRPLPEGLPRPRVLHALCLGCI